MCHHLHWAHITHFFLTHKYKYQTSHWQLHHGSTTQPSYLPNNLTHSHTQLFSFSVTWSMTKAEFSLNLRKAHLIKAHAPQYETSSYIAYMKKQQWLLSKRQFVRKLCHFLRQVMWKSKFWLWNIKQQSIQCLLLHWKMHKGCSTEMIWKLIIS